MPDWNRLIVGDAFKLPSANIDYYRDTFLTGPVLLFSILAIVYVVHPGSHGQRVYGLKLAVCAVLAILLAKERLALIAGGASFIALRLAVALVFTQDWRAYLLGFVLSAAIVCTILWARRNWKPYYESPGPNKTYVLTLLVLVAGFGAAMGIALWLKP
jgi:hypothetical protein